MNRYRAIQNLQITRRDRGCCCHSYLGVLVPILAPCLLSDHNPTLPQMLAIVEIMQVDFADILP